MKYRILGILLCFIASQSIAQISNRNIRFKTFRPDSIIIPLNEDYLLIEDSCASIMRYAHYNFQHKKFNGKFKDVSRSDTSLIVSEGTYNDDGLKNGLFTAHYLNGKLRSKGSFKNDQYDGKWEMYYDNGNLELTFEATDGVYHIIDAWKPDGTKVVDNGNGLYKADLGAIYWTGKLVSGKPDGTWECIATTDASNTAFVKEHFKKGEFRGGGGSNVPDYNGVSHIVLVSPDKASYAIVEKMLISEVPCNGVKRKHIINANRGINSIDMTQTIINIVNHVLSTKDLKGLEMAITINGEIDEKGLLGNFKSDNSYRDDITRGVINDLERLRALSPATVDGKPVKQKISITITFHMGYYNVSHRLLPIHIDQ